MTADKSNKCACCGSLMKKELNENCGEFKKEYVCEQCRTSDCECGAKKQVLLS